MRYYIKTTIFVLFFLSCSKTSRYECAITWRHCDTQGNLYDFGYEITGLDNPFYEKKQIGLYHGCNDCGRGNGNKYSCPSCKIKVVVEPGKYRVKDWRRYGSDTNLFPLYVGERIVILRPFEGLNCSK